MNETKGRMKKSRIIEDSKRGCVPQSWGVAQKTVKNMFKNGMGSVARKTMRNAGRAVRMK